MRQPIKLVGSRGGERFLQGRSRLISVRPMAREHLLDFSQSPARLSVSLDRLKIRIENQPEKYIPLADIAVVVVLHPNVSYSQAVLSGLMQAGGAFVCCGANRLPNGLLLPLADNGTQSERFTAQAEASKPVCKRLWKQITKAKIDAQATALEVVRGTDCGLRSLLPLVKSGDSTNIEARAARRYWLRLFADRGFRRNPELEDENELLNYGYAVVRAIVGRAICAAGMHPTIGLHHHNRYNAFCLADDLMEPLRPVVDVAVWRLVVQERVAELTPPSKRKLIAAIHARYAVSGEQRQLFDVASRMASSLSQVFLGQRKDLELPEFTPLSFAT